MTALIEILTHGELVETVLFAARWYCGLGRPVTIRNFTLTSGAIGGEAGLLW